MFLFFNCISTGDIARASHLGSVMMIMFMLMKDSSSQISLFHHVTLKWHMIDVCVRFRRSAPLAYSSEIRYLSSAVNEKCWAFRGLQVPVQKEWSDLTFKSDHNISLSHHHRTRARSTSDFFHCLKTFIVTFSAFNRHFYPQPLTSMTENAFSKQPGTQSRTQGSNRGN